MRQPLNVRDDPNRVKGQYIRGTITGIEKKVTVVENRRVNQEILDRATDLFIDEKSKLLKYKNLDQGLIEAKLEFSSGSEEEDDDLSSEEDSDLYGDSDFEHEFDEFDVEFNELPPFHGFQY